jgi:hypothetical protein
MMRAAFLLTYTVRRLDTMQKLLSCALLSVFLAAAPPSFAADAKSVQLGTGKAVGKFLTRDELRACLAAKDKLTRWKTDAPQQRAALGDEKDTLSKNGEALAAELAALDRTSADAVGAFNKKSQAHDEAIDAFQKRVDAFNALVAADKTDTDAYAASCENRRYFVEDEAALKKGK